MVARNFMAVLAAALLLSATTSVAKTIAIIGTGDVAGALGPKWAAKGHTVIYGSRDPESEKVEALVGKTVIDPTNAFEISEARLAYRTTDEPVGVALQEAAPKANVVKALNAIWYGTMAEPESAGGPVTIPIAGNNSAAKAQVTRLIGELGFESMDMGPIRYSMELEGMLIVWMNARLNGRGFNYYFRPEKQP